MTLKGLKEKLSHSFSRRSKAQRKTAKALKRAQRSKAMRILMTTAKVFATLMLIVIITGCIVVTAVSIYIARAGSSELIDIRRMELSYTTILYYTDSSGNNQELTRLYGDQNRIWVSLDNIPTRLIDATIAVEDERFLDHNGVDWKRTIGAFVNLVVPIWSSQQGGSTITQQLIKNYTGEKEANGLEGIQRKVKEIIRALVLESRYTKEDIIEAYLNTMPFSNNTVGIQAAANLYFGKDVKDLTLAEAASLVAVTKSPETYNPLTNPEANKERQKVILAKMLDQGKIKQEEYDEAVAQELVFKTKEVQASVQQVQSYFVDQVTEDVIDDLQTQYGYSETEATNRFYQGGYRIYTTEDPSIQSNIEAVFQDLSSFPTYKTQAQPQSSMVIMDFQGNIKGLVGGRGEKTGARVLNRATQALRPIGSTMKPIGVYGPAIEYNLINWSSVFPDQSIEVLNGDKVELFPNNYNFQFDGNMVVEDALKVSKNTIPVRIGELLKPQTIYNFLTQRLGITTLVNARQIGTKTFTDVTLASMCLGALTDGMTNEELVAAYQVFGNGGYYYSPRTYTKVLDAEGNVVLENKQQMIQAFSPETAEVMNKLLQRVVSSSNGTGRTSVFNSAMPQGGKTGTAADNKDQWWVGMTPYYVGAVWFGYDTPYPIPLAGSHPAIAAWKNVMSRVHKGLAVKQFPTTGNLEQHTYCKITGKLAGPTCTSTGDGWYKKDNVPGICDGNHS